MTDTRTELELPGELVIPEPKQQVTLRLDTSILDYYRGTGPRWQTRINADLAFMVRTRQARAQERSVPVAAKRPRKGSR